MTMCLTMIVKNEAEVIERCIASVKNQISSWCIVDTGSTDGTQDKIQELLADVPGVLYKREWVDFGHNRTELMSLAHGAADHLLLLDADMTIEGKISNLNPDLSYYVTIMDGELKYSQMLLVRGNHGRWSYKGVTHEYITPEDSHNVEILERAHIFHHADGGSRAEKFTRDLELLLKSYDENPTDPRTVFYLAQTYRDTGENDMAASFYGLRAALGGWMEEVYCSLIYSGRLTESPRDFLQAASVCPNRAEALYELAKAARMQGAYRLAYQLASAEIEPPPDALFSEQWIYDWGLSFELGIAAFWVGDYETAIAACTRVAASNDVPSNFQGANTQNLAYALERSIPVQSGLVRVP